MKQIQHPYARNLYGLLGLWYASGDAVKRLAVWRYLWGIATQANKVPQRRDRYISAARTLAGSLALAQCQTLGGLHALYAVGTDVISNQRFYGGAVDLDDLLAPGPDGKRALTWPVVEGAAYWWRAHELGYDGASPALPLGDEAASIALDVASTAALDDARLLLARLAALGLR